MNRGLRCTSIWTSGPSPMQRKLCTSPALMTRMIGAGEPMRAALKRQVLLADSVHLAYALEWVESAAVRAMNQFGTPRTGACARTSNPNRS